MGSGVRQPLDDYLTRASDTFDVDDFIPALLRSNRWGGAFGEPLGRGALLEIPVNCESYNLAYLPRILEHAGVDVPRSWQEYFAAARSIVAHAAPPRGFAQRGADEWHTVYTGFASQLWAYGGRDFDASGKCVIDSPEALRATGDFIGALRDAGPLDWTHQRWYELAMDFAAGDYGLIVDSDHYVAFFENPEMSKVHGQVHYALPPLGPTARRSANVWTWSAVMNARSRDKDTAWAFMEWATGKDFLLRSRFEGNMNPTRTSIWEDSSFVEFSSGWGSFSDVSRQLVEEVGSVLVTPAVNYIDMARRWTTALRSAYADPESLADILSVAAADIDIIAHRE